WVCSGCCWNWNTGSTQWERKCTGTCNDASVSPAVVNTTGPGNCVYNDLEFTDYARHGTSTSSIILGDYLGGQDDGIDVGQDQPADDAWTSGPHSWSFEKKSTGIAPEANLVVMGQQRPLRIRSQQNNASPEMEDSLNSSFSTGRTNNVDVL